MREIEHAFYDNDTDEEERGSREQGTGLQLEPDYPEDIEDVLVDAATQAEVSLDEQQTEEVNDVCWKDVDLQKEYDQDLKLEAEINRLEDS